MIVLEQGQVTEIINDEFEKIELIVTYQDGTTNRCIAYKDLTSPVRIGEQVLCNRTAVNLSLGTGGIDFIVANLSQPEYNQPGNGHIMKLRYTPLQLAFQSIEEQGSKFHHVFNEQMSLDGFPVIIGSLHSMVAPSVLGIKATNAKLKIIYIMSDGGSLPLAFSKTIKQLTSLNMISATITFGHAFGGDFEAVNIYSALLAAKYCLEADIAIVAMGPGIVGTGTIWGHTGIEQGEIANAVGVLSGKPVLVPRLNFADQRDRHQGISHHTLTVLEKICSTRATVTLPALNEEKKKLVMEKIKNYNLAEQYVFVTRDGKKSLQTADKLGISLQTMGRGIETESLYFEAAAAAGIYAAELAEM